MQKPVNIPSCSVIVLNYFGEKVLQETLNSLFNLNYPKDRLEIIVVDNASKDKSLDLIKTYAEKGKIISVLLDKNYGFSKGNNFGIKKAKGEYVALLNNDCFVDKNWLKNLIETAESDSSIFSVNSKILLYPKYTDINLRVDSQLAPMYAWISKSFLMDYSPKKKIYLPIWKDNFKDYMDIKIEASFDPSKDQTLIISVLLSTRGMHLNKKIDLAKLIKSTHPAVKILDYKLRPEEIEYRIKVDVTNSKLEKESKSKIQNAGIIVFQDGYGRDIGAVVRDSQQFYEVDNNQFNQPREVYATCGAAVLYRKKVLETIGLLDESYFMYYEDVDFCERARFAGFKSFYCPKAIVRHLHAFSSSEESPFFAYHVERGRLMHTFFNFPLSVFVTEYFLMAFFNAGLLFKILLSHRRLFYFVKSRKVKGNEVKVARRIQIMKALLFFLTNAPGLFIKRQKRLAMVKGSSVRSNYNRILSGDWYLK